MEKRLKRVRTIRGLLDAFNIRQWNYAIVGDGSGTTRDRTMGWGSVFFDQREPHIPHVVYGGSSYGTNILAEMLSFAFPLMWISGDKNRPPGVIHIHLFTDCEYMVKSSGTAGFVRRKRNRELWAMLDSFRRTGAVCNWHWVPRDIFDLNRFCHDMANEGRKAMIELDCETVEKYQGRLQ